MTRIFRTFLKDDNADYIPIYIEQSRPRGEVSVTKSKQNGFPLNNDIHSSPKILRCIETKETMYETMHHMAKAINYTPLFTNFGPRILAAKATFTANVQYSRDVRQICSRRTTYFNGHTRLFHIQGGNALSTLTTNSSKQLKEIDTDRLISHRQQ